MNEEDVFSLADKAGLGFVKHADPKDIVKFKRFAALIASAEREAWEHKYARLQSLMDIRETQPNKPCCLAEREACAKVCEDASEPDGADLAERIRARGQA